MTTPGTPGSINDVSTALLHSPDGGRTLANSLGDRFPGYTYLAPSPENVIRLAGRSERFCAYQGNLGTIPMHFHTMAEITLIRKVSGTGSLRVAGRHYPAASGLLAFVPSNVLHGQTGDTPLIKDVCMFDMGLVAPLLAKEPAQTELTQVCSRYPAAVQLTPEQTARVAGLFEELIAEAGTSTWLGSGTLAAAIIAHLLILFLREAALRREPAAETDASTPDLELARVLGYVQEHFTEPINRSTVARALGMRPETVSRLFKQSSGETFSAFVQHLRLGHAVELLEGTALSAAEIGQLSGFDSYRTFSRTFRNVYGKSPGAFRRP